VERVDHRYSVAERLYFGTLVHVIELSVTGCVFEVLAVELQFQLAPLASGLEDQFEAQDRAVPELKFRIGEDCVCGVPDARFSAKSSDQNTCIEEYPNC
jgi:hypothetical protein